VRQRSTASGNKKLLALPVSLDKTAREIRANRAVRDMNTAAGQALQNAVFAERHPFYGSVIRQHGGYHSGGARRCGCFCVDCTPAHQRLRSAAGAIEDLQCVARFDKIARHLLAHSAQPYKSHFHRVCSFWMPSPIYH
jgi:hypothetical protein